MLKALPHIKKIGKWVLIGLGMLIVLMLIASVVLYMMFPAEKLVKIAEEQLEEVLNGREVIIADAGINIFRQIHLKEVIIHDLPQYGEEPLFTAAEIQLLYNLAHIWKLEIEVQEVKIIDPTFTFKQFGTSYTNFSDFADTTQTTPPPNTETKSPPLHLQVTQASIQNLTYHQIKYDTLFVDTTSVKTMMALQVKGVSATSANLDVLNLQQLSLQLNIEKSSDNFYYYQAEMVEITTPADLIGTVDIGYNWQEYRIDAQLILDDSQIMIFQADTLAPIQLTPFDTHLHAKTEMNFANGVIDFKKINLELNQTPFLALTGTIVNLNTPYPRYDLELSETYIDLETVQTIIAPLFAPEMIAGGKLSFYGTRLEGALLESDPLYVSLKTQLQDGYVMTEQLTVDGVELETQFSAAVIADSTNPQLPIKGQNWIFDGFFDLDRFEINTDNGRQSIDMDQLTFEANTMLGEEFQSPRQLIDMNIQIDGETVSIEQPASTQVIDGYRAVVSAAVQENATRITALLDSLWIDNIQTDAVDPFSIQGFLVAEVTLTPEYQPQSAVFSLLDVGMMGSHLTADKIILDHLDQTPQIDGIIKLNQFDLHPFSPPEMNLTGQTNAEIRLNGLLTNLQAMMIADLDSFRLAKNDTLLIGPWQSSLKANIQGDAMQGHLHLDGHLENDPEIFELWLQADLTKFGLGGFSATIDSLFLHHAEVMSNAIPAHISESMGEMIIEGLTRVSGEVAGSDSLTFSLRVDFEDMAGNFFTEAQPDAPGLSVWFGGVGQAIIEGSGKFPAEDMPFSPFNLPMNIDGEVTMNDVNLSIEQEPFRRRDPALQAEIRNTTANLDLQWTPQQKTAAMTIHIGEIEELIPQSITDISVQFRTTLDPTHTLEITDCRLNMPSHRLTAKMGGSVYNMNLDTYYQTLMDTSNARLDPNQQLMKNIYPDINLQVSLSAGEEGLNLPYQSFVSGNTAIQMTISRHIPEDTAELPNQFKIDGSLGFYNVNLKQEEMLNVEDMTGYLPFVYLIDVDVLRGKKPSVSSLNYEQAVTKQRIQEVNHWHFAPYAQHARQRSQLRIEKLRWDRYELNHIRLSAKFDDNVIRIREIELDLYEGHLWGSMYFDTAGGLIDQMHYRLYCEMTNVNFDALSNVKSKRRKKALLSTNFALQGRGIDFKKDFDLEGEFDITQIGKDVADRLLTFLDPENKDPSLASVRMLVKTGYKIERFTSRINLGILSLSVYLRPPLLLRWLHLPNPIPVPRISIGQLAQQMEAMQKSEQ